MYVLAGVLDVFQDVWPAGTKNPCKTGEGTIVTKIASG